LPDDAGTIMRRKTRTIVFLLTTAMALAADLPRQVAGRTPASLPAGQVISGPAADGAAASVSATPLDDLLPVSADQEGKARLWTVVYSDYDSSQLILYHRFHPEIIYGATANRPGSKHKALAEVRARLLALDRISRAPDPHREIAAHPQAPALRELYQKLDIVEGRDRFARAARPDAIGVMRGRRNDLVAAYARAAPFLPAMERIFKEEGVPAMLTRLVFVESMFSRNALSPKGAYGLWQFLPATARDHLVMNAGVDERRDPLASSQAAARILIENYRLLGSWPLAVTAYNAGAPRLQQAQRQAGSSRLLRVLAHDRHGAFGACVNNFYLQLVGVARAEQRLGLAPRDFPATFDPGRYDEVRLPRSCYLRDLSRDLGIKPELLIAYNQAWTPAVEAGTMPVPAGCLLRVPAGSGPVVAQVLQGSFKTIISSSRTEGYGASRP
jgi:membrane-bound lytic murein transglycosylase D